MSDTVIQIENLWKEYRLGGINHHTLTLDLQSWWARVRGKEDPNSQIAATCSPNIKTEGRFWALHGVSFEVKQGDILGIIGRNGAGKSTLLKILSQVTAPTKGEVRYKGRIASLLEVGTGFHPELTGRENIFLNGAILGMSKTDIRNKFDEIVAFAEVEKFIDTPVKRYSSGMYVRLAFAVAAHLQTDILVVDEVLAVGDVEFQKKCLGKLEAVSEKEGRTVLFVSHNMAIIQRLCTRGMVLENGKIICFDSQMKAVEQYLSKSGNNSLSLDQRTDRKGSGKIKIVNIEYKNTDGHSLDVAFSGQDIEIFLYYESNEENKTTPVNVGLTIKTQLDVPVFSQTSALKQIIFKEMPKKGAFVCRINKLPLPATTYRLSFSLIVQFSGEYLDGMNDVAELTVVDGDYFGSGIVPSFSHGVCLVDAAWRLVP